MIHGNPALGSMAPIAKGRGREAARSRNTTPMSTASTEPNSAVRLATPVATTYSDIMELCKSQQTPNSDQLKRVLEGLNHRDEVAKRRADLHDKGMRETSKRKKEEMERQRDQMLIKREEDEKKERARQPQPSKDREERPLAIGAHSVAAQDGTSNKCTCVPSPSLIRLTWSLVASFLHFPLV